MKNSINIFCDGGSRGNPGRAASAFVIEKNGKEIFSEATFLGRTTNNVAEYQAVLLALKWLTINKDKLGEEIKFTLDSELVVRQINGIYKVKNPDLKKIYLEIKKLLLNFSQEIIFENVSREKNKRADFLVNEKLDEVP